MDERKPTLAMIILGTIGTVVFFLLIYQLASDPHWLPGLGRVSNLNFEFNIGELIFGILGGGAAIWAAKTFATLTGRSATKPGSTPPGAATPPPPDIETGGDTVIDEEEARFAGLSYDEKFMELFRLLRKAESQPGLQSADSYRDEPAEA